MPTVNLTRSRDAKRDDLLRAARAYADVEGCEHPETIAEAFSALRVAACDYDKAEMALETRREKATKPAVKVTKTAVATRPVPEVGARWQIVTGTMGGVSRFRIDKLDAVYAWVTFDGGRNGNLSRATLARGLRGARPVKEEVAA